MVTDDYLKKLGDVIRELLDDYLCLHDKIDYKISYSVINDNFEIVNYQLNSIETNLQLAESGRYREALSSTRTILENYLLFELRSVCDVYILPTGELQKTKSDCKKKVQEMNILLAEAHRKGDAQLVQNAVSLPYMSKMPGWIVRGTYIDGKEAPENLVPYYYRLAQEYDPTSAHLDLTKYFHYSGSVNLENRLREFHKEQNFLHFYHFTLPALKYALHLNGRLDYSSELRLDAHHQFLSNFVHPSNYGLKIIKARNEQRSGIKSLNELNEKNPTVQLLILLYSGFLACMFCEKLIESLNNLRPRLFNSFNPESTIKLITEFYEKHRYFWFIWNSATEYDRYIYACDTATKAMTSDEIASIDENLIKFDHSIATRLHNLQYGMEHTYAGKYTPPF